jgi:hypothetical protein
MQEFLTGAMSSAMGMSNPHDPIKALWEGYNTAIRNKDFSNAEYYYDQWEKQCEKLVKLELEAKKVKAAADEPKPRPVKPKDAIK